MFYHETSAGLSSKYFFRFFFILAHVFVQHLDTFEWSAQLPPWTLDHPRLQPLHMFSQEDALSLAGNLKGPILDRKKSLVEKWEGQHKLPIVASIIVYTPEV